MYCNSVIVRLQIAQFFFFAGNVFRLRGNYGLQLDIRNTRRDTQCADNGKKNSVARADLCRPCPVSSCLAAHTRFQRPCFFWCFLRLCCKTPYRTSVLKRIWRITFRSICRIYPSICPSGITSLSPSCRAVTLFVQRRAVLRSWNGDLFPFPLLPARSVSELLRFPWTSFRIHRPEFRRTRTWMLVFF